MHIKNMWLSRRNHRQHSPKPHHWLTLKDPAYPSARAVRALSRPRDGLRRYRTASRWQVPPPAARRSRSRRRKRPRAPSRCRRPRPAAADAKLHLALVHDGVGRQVKHPGDDGHGGARRRVPESPRDGYLAPEGARAGTAAMRGRPVDHSERRGATPAGSSDWRGATTTREARRGTTATGGSAQSDGDVGGVFWRDGAWQEASPTGELPLLPGGTAPSHPSNCLI